MICFDTAVLIWGVQGAARKGQEEMIQRTRSYIEYLTRENVQIIVPSPVVTEYLSGFEDDEQRDQQQRLLERHFVIPSFDHRAAVLAAELGLRGDDRKQIIASGVDRQALKVDAQIVAIGITQGAERIISPDPHLERIARGRIQVQGVPKVSPIDQLALAEEW